MTRSSQHHSQRFTFPFTFTSLIYNFLSLQVTRTTIEYLFGILTRLQPLSEDTEAEVMQRTLSTLTHQHMCAEYTVNSSIASNVSRRTMNTGEMSNNMVHFTLYFEIGLLLSGNHFLQLKRYRWRHCSIDADVRCKRTLDMMKQTSLFLLP